MGDACTRAPRLLQAHYHAWLLPFERWLLAEHTDSTATVSLPAALLRRLAFDRTWDAVLVKVVKGFAAEVTHGPLPGGIAGEHHLSTDAGAPPAPAPTHAWPACMHNARRGFLTRARGACRRVSTRMRAMRAVRAGLDLVEAALAPVLGNVPVADLVATFRKHKGCKALQRQAEEALARIAPVQAREDAKRGHKRDREATACADVPASSSEAPLEQSGDEGGAGADVVDGPRCVA
jgi:hypothetical protein